MKKLYIILSLLLIFVNGCDIEDPVSAEPAKPIITEISKPVIIKLSETMVSKPISKDRCIEYLSEIRSASIKYLGLGYPYWYNVGVAMTESSCRGNIASFDGGIGLFQLTPSKGITEEISKHIPVDPYNTESNIRAQAYYMYRIINTHFKQGNMTMGKSKYKFNPKEHVEQCGLRLADVGKFYNSGYWFFAEANIGSTLDCSNNKMAAKSVRGGTCVGKQYLSFGKTSYSYPIKVWKYSQPYKGITDGTWSYWYNDSDKVLTVEFPVNLCP